MRKVLTVIFFILYIPALVVIGFLSIDLGEVIAVIPVNKLQRLTESITHQVTVVWINNQEPCTFDVREDRDWNVFDGMGSNRLATYGVTWENDGIRYQTLESNEPTLEKLKQSQPNALALTAIAQAEKKGLTFGGLFTLPSGGGVQYADQFGHTIKTVTEDVTLYALWQ